jgi:hypothetical protein
LQHRAECDGGRHNVIESFSEADNLTDRTGAASGNDVHDSIWIVKDNKCEVAVVYSEPDCNGKSMFATPMAWEQAHGSEANYHAN